MNLAHLSLPGDKNDQLVVDHIIRSMGNKPLQQHLLTADTTTLTSSVQTIEEYLAIGSLDRPACRTVRQETELVVTLTAQSEVLAKVVVRLEELEQSYKETSVVPQHSEVWRLVRQYSEVVR